jgi:dTDP-4-amino-4,6-dideoxygalactose transaminase
MPALPDACAPGFTLSQIAIGYEAGDFPKAERAERERETIALPIYPELTMEQQRYVVESIRSFVR